MTRLKSSKVRKLDFAEAGAKEFQRQKSRELIRIERIVQRKKRLIRGKQP